MFKSKTWNQYFFEMADLVASKSKDQSTQVGVIVVGADNEILSTGFNGFPRGVDETLLERWERPIKYMFIEHAERNAIHNASRMGVSLKGSTMYTNFIGCPCTECAKAIIQSGIKKIIGNGQKFSGKGEHWEIEMQVAKIMLDEAGVEITQSEENHD